MQNTVSRGRPLGVTIIAVLLGISGIVELIIGILVIVAIFALGRTIAVHGHTTTGGLVDVVGGILGGISLIVGLVTLIFVWGLWTLKRWAFWLTVIVEAFVVLRHVYEFTLPNHSVVSIVLGMIIPVVILVYFLLDPNVRRAFRIGQG